MQAWTADASSVHIGSLRESPYARPSLQQFLTSELGDPAKILVAPKGYGKTLFLKLKAHALRRKLDGGIPVFPDSSSDIEFLKLSLDWRELNQIARPLTNVLWSLLWQFVLIGKGVQLVADEELRDEQIRPILGNPKLPISDILTDVLRAHHSRTLNVTQKLHLLRNAFNNSGRSVVIFIDNADEMFVASDHETSAADRDSGWGALPEMPPRSAAQATQPDKEAHAREAPKRLDHAIWCDAQVGLMLAVREIERSTRKLNVYSSLRAEAVVSANHPLAVQAMAHTVRIQYSKNELRRIFEWHINLMKRQDLASPEAEDPVERLVGPAAITHSYVKVNGAPAEEALVDLLARHTCYSPRELVVLGGAVAALSVDERLGQERSELIRSRVNELATSLYFAFRRNFIPRWPAEIDAALLRVQSAVLSPKAIQELGNPAAQSLFAYGLLGYALETQNPREYRQHFLNHWDTRFASESVVLPQAKYYFLHPWLFDYCVARNKRFRRSPHNIIGDGCIFSPPAPAKAWLTRDPERRAILTIDDDICWPNTRSQRMTMPVVFMMTLVIAVSREGSVYIDEAAFKSAFAVFKRTFPEFGGTQPLDPFARGEHRAHLDKSIESAFPRLRTRFSNLSSLFEFHGGKGRSKAFEALFVTPGSVSFDC